MRHPWCSHTHDNNPLHTHKKSAVPDWETWKASTHPGVIPPGASAVVAGMLAWQLACHAGRCACQHLQQCIRGAVHATNPSGVPLHCESRVACMAATTHQQQLSAAVQSIRRLSLAAAAVSWSYAAVAWQSKGVPTAHCCCGPNTPLIRTRGTDDAPHGNSRAPHEGGRPKRADSAQHPQPPLSRTQ